MVTRKHKAKMKPSRRSLVKTLSNFPKAMRTSLSSRLPQLPEANIFISLLNPSNLPPLALNQYNYLTNKQQESFQTGTDAVTEVSSSERETISSPLLSCTHPNSEPPPCKSSLLSVDDYFTYEMQPYTSCSPRKETLDFCTPDSPLSIDDGKEGNTFQKYYNNATKVTGVGTEIENYSSDIKVSVKKCTVVLQPVNKSMKTVYLNGKQNFSESENTESLSSHSRKTCSPKDSKSEFTDNCTENCILESMPFETLNKAQLESEMEGSSSKTPVNKPAPRRWVKSITLKNTPHLKQSLSAKRNSSTLKTDMACITNASGNEAEESNEIPQIPSVNEEKRPSEREFKQCLKTDRVNDGTSESKNYTVSRARGHKFQSSFRTTHGMAVGQKWIASVNLKMSPLIPKPTSLCMKKPDHIQLDQHNLDLASAKKGLSKVRRNILLDDEAIELSNSSSESEQEVGSGCIVDTVTHPNAVLSDNERCCTRRNDDVSIPNAIWDGAQLLKKVETKPIKCVQSGFEKRLLSTGDGKNNHEADNSCCDVLAEMLSGDTTALSCKKRQRKEKANEHGSQRKLLLLKTKTFVEHKKRKRTLSGSLVPQKKRLRTFSSCNSTNSPEDNTLPKEVPPVTEWNSMYYNEKHSPPLSISSELDQEEDIEIIEATEKCVNDNWLLCDRSVDSIPPDDEPEKNNSTETLRRTQEIVYQDHSYSIRTLKSDLDTPNSFDIPSPRVKSRDKVKNVTKVLKSGKEKTKKKKRGLTNYELQKKYNLTVPLKNVIINCELLNPANLNILSIPEKPLKCKRRIHSKKKSARVNVKEKRKNPEDRHDTETPRPKKPRVPQHYRGFKPEQIRTIKHIGMRYRVAFHLWPQKYSNALDKINQRIASQNAFWKTLL